MRVETVHESDKPEDSLESLVYTGQTKGIYTVYSHNSPYPEVEIESISPINHVSIKKALETILLQGIEPHDRFSFRFHIHFSTLNDADILDIYRDAVVGIVLLGVRLGLELKDTLVPYIRRYGTSSIFICKGYFKNKIVFTQMSGSLAEDSICDAVSHRPDEFFAQLANIF